MVGKKWVGKSSAKFTGKATSAHDPMAMKVDIISICGCSGEGAAAVGRNTTQDDTNTLSMNLSSRSKTDNGMEFYKINEYMKLMLGVGKKGYTNTMNCCVVPIGEELLIGMSWP
ncbi:hypothetical protein BX661DRAFT_169247 [Kickxella alabastrina]|uniref:uncharacterized protein n=1 Tax=Kickxella alabastrina TaxID=61397 RepID=UPI00221E6D8E|nr:uncharacterized protein BX661DRAFT_169247 [Kickxella alabastrina]KAI7833404.1 hypothetical protein BX661DRAFT_169247 [Kickxella alabastrina]